MSSYKKVCALACFIFICSTGILGAYYSPLFPAPDNESELWFVYSDGQTSGVACYNTELSRTEYLLTNAIGTVDPKILSQCTITFTKQAIVIGVPGENGYLRLFAIERTLLTGFELNTDNVSLTSITAMPGTAGGYIVGDGTGSLYLLNLFARDTMHQSVMDITNIFENYSCVDDPAVRLIEADKYYDNLYWICANNQLYYAWINEHTAAVIILVHVPQPLSDDILYYRSLRFTQDTRRGNILWLGPWRINKRAVLGQPLYYRNRKSVFQKVADVVPNTQLYSAGNCAYYNNMMYKFNARTAKTNNSLPVLQYISSYARRGNLLFYIVHPAAEINIPPMMVVYDMRKKITGVYDIGFNRVQWPGVINERFIKLIEEEQNNNKYIKIGELLLLIAFNDLDEFIPVITGYLTHSENMVSLYAASALAYLHDDSMAEKLIEIFRSTDSIRIREYVIYILSYMESDSLKDFYGTVMHPMNFPISDEPTLRTLTIEKRLLESAVQQFPESGNIYAGVTNYFEKRFVYYYNLLPESADKIFSAYLKLNPDILAALTEQTRNYTLKLYLIKKISESDNEAVRTVLVCMTKSADRELAFAAMESLAKLQDETVLDMLDMELAAVSVTGFLDNDERLLPYIELLQYYPPDTALHYYNLFIPIQRSSVRQVVYKSMSRHANAPAIRHKLVSQFAVEQNHPLLQQRIIEALVQYKTKDVTFLMMQVFSAATNPLLLSYASSNISLNWNKNMNALVTTGMTEERNANRRYYIYKLFLEKHGAEAFVFNDDLKMSYIDYFIRNEKEDWLRQLLLYKKCQQMMLRNFGYHPEKYIYGTPSCWPRDRQ